MAGQVGQIVRVVNRTTKPLTVTFDGRQYNLVPGYREMPDGTVEPAGPHGEVAVTHLDYLKAEMARRQNPRKGTENPRDPADVEHLVAIVEDGHDVSWLEQSDAVERLDRSQIEDAKVRNAEVVAGVGFPGRRSGRSQVAEHATHFQDGLIATGRDAQ